MKIALLRLSVNCLGRLPLPVRALMGRYCGLLFSLIPTRDRKIARLQMKLCLQHEGGDRHLSAVYGSVGETLLECFNLKPLLDNYEEHVDTDWSQWDEILSRKKGIVILSAHTGNWEFLAACSIKRGYKVSVVGKANRDAGFQNFMAWLRQGYGAETIWRTGASGLKQFLGALRKGESVAALIDQDTRVENVSVPFFGRPAATPVTMIEIAKKAQAVIIAPFIFRTGRNRYRIVVKELDSALPSEAILAEFNVALENLIREYPEQWVWFHKRWRTDAHGTRLSSREYLQKLEQEAILL